MADEPSFISSREPIVPPWQKKTIIAPKKLFSSLSSLHSETFRVVLRMKPNLCGNKTHIVQDPNTIITQVPSESVSSNFHKSLASTRKKFTFSLILEEDASQFNVYEECMRSSVKLFLKGEDTLVMAYGTTSAGKTYTMHGTAAQPGIIPRVLTHIFRSLENNLNYSVPLRPHRNYLLQRLSNSECQEMEKHKNTILGLNIEKYRKSADSSYVTFRSFSGEKYESAEYQEMERSIGVLDEAPQPDSLVKFTVWISMVEIYNENIVDLLMFPNERPSLTLGEDDQGGFYVKNAKLVCVRNGDEAYKVTQFGRCNLSRASTALNDKSSRSHCLLTVTLVGHRPDGSHTINRITLADLAGSERAKKTGNNGKRLMESNSINKSLSALGNCLKALKEQTSRSHLPIRDSKLTMLFKNALHGSDKLTFIVNISTDPHLFDETLAVLKFSALAQEIIVDPSSRKPTRFSKLFFSDNLPSFSAPSLPDLTRQATCAKCEEYGSVFDELQELRKREIELENEITRWQKEVQLVTQELFDKGEQAEEIRQLYNEAQKQLEASKPAIASDNLLKIITEKNKQRNSDIKALRAKHSKEVQELYETINELKTSQKELQCKNDSLKKEMAEISEDNEDLKELLNEAKEDFAELLLNRTALEEQIQQMVLEMSEKVTVNEELKEEISQRILLHNKEEVKVVEYECKINDLKVLCHTSQKEIETLQAAVSALEQEACASFQANAKLTAELEASKKEKEVLIEETRKLREEVHTHSKLTSLFRCLERELINKSYDLQEIEKDRTFLISQHQREVGNYLEEIENLKKMMSDRNKPPIDDIKRLGEICFTEDSVKAMRSPLRNRTNAIVPDARLLSLLSNSSMSSPLANNGKENIVELLEHLHFDKTPKSGQKSRSSKSIGYLNCFKDKALIVKRNTLKKETEIKEEKFSPLIEGQSLRFRKTESEFFNGLKNQPVTGVGNCGKENFTVPKKLAMEDSDCIGNATSMEDIIGLKNISPRKESTFQQIVANDKSDRIDNADFLDEIIGKENVSRPEVNIDSDCRDDAMLPNDIVDNVPPANFTVGDDNVPQTILAEDLSNIVAANNINCPNLVITLHQTLVSPPENDEDGSSLKIASSKFDPLIESDPLVKNVESERTFPDSNNIDNTSEAQDAVTTKEDTPPKQSLCPVDDNKRTDTLSSQIERNTEVSITTIAMGDKEMNLNDKLVDISDQLDDIPLSLLKNRLDVQPLDVNTTDLRLSPPSPPPVSKSTRKPRTARKNQPEHPALASSSRRRVRSSSRTQDVPPPPRSAKKQLFTDDLIFLDDDSDDFTAPDPNYRRNTRAQSKKYYQ